MIAINSLSTIEYMELSRIALADNRLMKSLMYAKKALELCKTNSEVYYQIAKIYENMEQYNMANRYYYLAMAKISKASVLIELKIAVNYAKLGDWGEAFSLFQSYSERAFRLSKEEEMNDYVLKMEFIQKVEETKSLQGITDASIKLIYPYNDQYYLELINKAKKEITQDNLNSAIALLNKIPDSYKFYSLALDLRVFMALAKEDCDQVEAMANKLIKENKYLVSAYCYLTNVAHIKEDEEGEKKNAIQAFKMVNKLDYNELFKVQSLLTYSALYDEMEQVLRWKLELRPFESETYITLGVLLYNKGELRGSISSFNNARILDIEHGLELNYLEAIKEKSYMLHYPVGLILSKEKDINDTINKYQKKDKRERLVEFCAEDILEARFCFTYCNLDLCKQLLEICDKLYNEQLENMIYELIIDNNISNQIRCLLLEVVVNHANNRSIKCVIDDNYIEIDCRVPIKYKKSKAYRYAYAKSVRLLLQVYGSDAQIAINDLSSRANDYSMPNNLKLINAISAVLCYDKESKIMDNQDSIIENFHTSKAMFNKYLSLMRGIDG